MGLKLTLSDFTEAVRGRLIGALEYGETATITLIGTGYSKTFEYQRIVKPYYVYDGWGVMKKYYGISTTKNDSINFVFQCEANTKTLKLKNLPQDNPSLSNIVWKDLNGFLRLS